MAETTTTTTIENDAFYHLEGRLSDIRMETKESESEIKGAISGSQLDLNANFRSLDNTLSRNAAESAKEAKDIEKSIAQNRYDLHDNILKAKGELADRISDAAALTLATTNALALETAKNFAIAELSKAKDTASILASIASTELRAVQDELNELRLQRCCDKNKYELALQNVEFNNLKATINAMEQKQSNQAINFGLGAIGAQSTTSNQVR